MLSNLNEQQRLAVLAVNGPVMVFAGAGSGKTRTLTYRVAHMIDKEKIAPHNILAITFTKKATNEMKERLIELIGPSAFSVHISTFHSLCARILRYEITNLGYGRNFNIVDEEEQLKFINDLLKDNNIDRKLMPGKHIQKVIKHCKSFSKLPSDSLELNIYNLYQKKMEEENLLDFDDLLIKMLELLEKFPKILKKYQDIFQYVLVDEFQDTNLTQYNIVKLLTKESKNLFVVGDDDQSIYSFRGTNYENMQLFKEDYPEHQLFYLTENYRSPQSILDGCNRLIANNINREKKELFSSNPGEESDVVVYQAFNEKVEVDYVFDQIFSLRLKNVEYKDIAILYRSSVLLRNLELGAINANIPYKVYGGVPYLRRREVKDVVAYFKFILDNDDLYSFRRIINTPSRMLGDTTISKVLEIQENQNISIFDAIDLCEQVLSERRCRTLHEFKAMIIKYKSRIEHGDLILLYEDLLEEIGYREYLKNQTDGDDRLDNIEEFKSILKQIEESSDELSIEERLTEAFDQALLSDDAKQTQRQDEDGITLSTIHSVKGLEFPYVFVIGLEENVFPNVRRYSDEDEVEEERRIAYVAFTRAKERLYLLTSQNRLLYGDRFSNEPSRFLVEYIGMEAEKELFRPKQMKSEKLEQFKKQKFTLTENNTDFELSDKVIHQKFGEGIIIAINKNIGQIFFNSLREIKSIMLSHPALKKKE